MVDASEPTIRLIKVLRSACNPKVARLNCLWIPSLSGMESVIDKIYVTNAAMQKWSGGLSQTGEIYTHFLNREFKNIKNSFVDILVNEHNKRVIIPKLGQ